MQGGLSGPYGTAGSSSINPYLVSSQLSALNISRPPHPDFDEIYAFLSGTGKDRPVGGRTIHDIWKMSAHEKSIDFTYMQWLFPTDHESPSDPTSPYCDAENFICMFRENVEIMQNVKKSFANLLEYMGLQYDGSKVTRAPNYDQQSRIWFHPASFFFKSITRCLSSLQLFGLEKELEAFSYFLCTIKHHAYLGYDTFNTFWAPLMHETVKKSPEFLAPPPANPYSPYAVSSPTLSPLTSSLASPNPSPYIAPSSYSSLVPISVPPAAATHSPAAVAVDPNPALDGVDKVTCFYTNKCTDSDKRTLVDLWKMPNSQKLKDERYLLWLFPVFQMDPKDEFAPVVSLKDFEKLRENKELVAKVITSFIYILQSLDLVYDYNQKKVIPCPDFEEKTKLWMSNQSTYYIQLSRIMLSLRLFGLEDESKALLAFLEFFENDPRMNTSNFKLWKEIGQLNIKA